MQCYKISVLAFLEVYCHLLCTKIYKHSHLYKELFRFAAVHYTTSCSVSKAHSNLTEPNALAVSPVNTRYWIREHPHNLAFFNIFDISSNQLVHNAPAEMILYKLFCNKILSKHY